MKRIQIFDIPIDALTMQETVEVVQSAIIEHKILHHVVVNAAKIVNLKKDAELRESIVNCDIINADGQSIVWASRILGKSLPERVSGIDLMINLVRMAADKGFKVFLLGATEEVVSKVATMYEEVYGKGIIAGYRNGYYKKEEERLVAEQIAGSKADMLFVAITSPKKEIFLNKYKDLIKVPFIMGVGGSFDVISGKTKRAPKWMQRVGMEWFFRVIQEPKRMWKRYLYGNSEFIYIVFKEKMKQIFGTVKACFA